MSNADREGAARYVEQLINIAHYACHVLDEADFDAIRAATSAHRVEQLEVAVTAFCDGGEDADIHDFLDRARAVLASIIPTPPPAAEAGERIADTICRDVAELPDRTSPDDAPEMMLVTTSELRAIVTSALQASRTSLLTTPSYQDGVDLTWEERGTVRRARSIFRECEIGWARDYARDLLAIIDRLTPSTAGKETT